VLGAEGPLGRERLDAPRRLPARGAELAGLAEHWYDRGVDAFLRDAYSSGQTRYLAHLLHAGATGALPQDFYEDGLPAPSRRLVRVSRRPLGHRATVALLRFVLAVAGLVRLHSVERHTGYVLGAIEGQRGALDAAQGRSVVSR
jgi:hypothetical protein